VNATSLQPRRGESGRRIAHEIAAACKDAAFARAEKIGVDPVCGTPPSFSRAIAETWRSGKRRCRPRDEAAMTLRIAIPT